MRDSQKSARWNLKNLIRFEYHRIADGLLDETEVQDRDKSFTCENGVKIGDRRRAFLNWTFHRNRVDGAAESSVKFILSGRRVMSLLSIVAGAILGALVSLSLLRYDGSVPVNVAYVWGIAVAPQILFGTLALTLMVFGALWSKVFEIFYRLPIWIFEQVTQRLIRHGLTSSETQTGEAEKWELRLGVLRSWFESQQNLVGIWALVWIQWFGFSLNLALLVVAFLQLTFTDRTFGWQSSIVDDPEVVKLWVDRIAVPIDTILPGSSVGLTFQQIESTHTTISGFRHEYTDPVWTVWWPFILGSIVVYGLLPRLIFLGISFGLERIYLSRLNFRGHIYHSLWNRLTLNQLSVEGNKAEVRADENKTESATMVNPKGKWTLLVPKKVTKRYDLSKMQHFVVENTGLDIGDVVQLENGLNEAVGFETSEVRTLLLVEGWQPPIVEQLEEIRTLAGRVPNGMFIYLLGKPESSTPTMLDSDAEMVWRQKINSLSVNGLVLFPRQLIASE